MEACSLRLKSTFSKDFYTAHSQLFQYFSFARWNVSIWPCSTEIAWKAAFWKCAHKSPNRVATRCHCISCQLIIAIPFVFSPNRPTWPIQSICQNVCLWIYTCTYMSPSHAIFLGLSLALRSHDQFEASHYTMRKNTNIFFNLQGEPPRENVFSSTGHKFCLFFTQGSPAWSRFGFRSYENFLKNFLP